MNNDVVSRLLSTKVRRSEELEVKSEKLLPKTLCFLTYIKKKIGRTFTARPTYHFSLITFHFLEFRTCSIPPKG